MANGAPDISTYYQTPEITSAEQQYQQAAASSGQYQEALPLLAQKLKDAIQQKLNYNQDIISQQNKAMADYFAAPSEARQQYQNIWDPFAREALVSRATSNAYAPYATLTDILGERRGQISDLVNAGTGAFQSAATAQQNRAEQARSALDQLLQMAGIKAQSAQWQYGTNLANQQWLYEQTHAKPTAGGEGLDLSGLLGLFGGGGGGTTAQPTEPKPTIKPSSGQAEGRLWTSPRGEWAWDYSINDWVPISD